MSFDNRQFVVNGEMENRPQFDAALELVLSQSGWSDIDGYTIDPKHGLLLFWTDNIDGLQKFPFGKSLERVSDFVWSWLRSQPKCEITDENDSDVDHDGHNSIGWKIYFNDALSTYAFAAVKPVYLWYGK